MISYKNNLLFYYFNNLFYKQNNKGAIFGNFWVITSNINSTN